MLALKTNLALTLFVGLALGLGHGLALAASSSQMPSAEAVAPGADQSGIQKAAQGEAHAEHGLPQAALEVARPFGFPITNSMVVSWIVALGLIVFAQVATRRMKRIPDGAQNFWEWLVESLSNFLEGVIGPHLVKRTFWYFATIFIFILFSNWAG